MRTLAAPFPWFGGKSRVAELVWDRFGDVANYVEPFFGSGAVLLGRPHPPGIETVNDRDCYLANFWRALQCDPDEVAYYADWPVNEADQHARHLWLQNQTDWAERMKTDPEYYDAKIAGWWVWGQSIWIGAGWCSESSRSRQLPHLGDAGTGVHRKRPEQETPVRAYMRELAERLRKVRICCGDWSRVCGPSPTFKNGLTGVFLDPPYSEESGRDNQLYAQEDTSVAHAVCAWAVANGDNPELRIALCGYAGEHVMPSTWREIPWKARGGYGSQGNGTGRENAGRERVWFSPACLEPPTLFPLDDPAFLMHSAYE